LKTEAIRRRKTGSWLEATVCASLSENFNISVMVRSAALSPGANGTDCSLRQILYDDYTPYRGHYQVGNGKTIADRRTRSI